MAHAKHRRAPTRHTWARRRNPAVQGAFSFGTPKEILTAREQSQRELDKIIRSHTATATPQLASAVRSLDDIINAHASPKNVAAAVATIVKSKKASPTVKAAAKKIGKAVKATAKPAAKPAKKPAKKKPAPKGYAQAAPKASKKGGSKAAPTGHDAKAKKRAWMKARGFSTASIEKALSGKGAKGGKKGGKKSPAKVAAKAAKKLRTITPKYLKYAQTRKGVKKHLRARVSIKAKRKVAGLLVLNPRTGAVMSRVLVANPKKKHHARRARNPVGTAVRTVKAQLLPMGAGAAAGFVAGYVDTKFLSDKPLVSVIGKIVMGVAGAYLIAKKNPSAAAGWAGGALGATGYQQGVKFGGGHVALSGLGALQGVADMAADDPEMANLIADLSDEQDGMGDAASDYSQALGDEDNVQDIVTDE